MSSTPHVLVLGGGIAGCTLGVTLIKHNVRVTLISNDSLPSSTAVAAGVYNPVVIKRLTLNTKLADAARVARNFYEEVQQQLHVTFHNRLSMVRVFSNAGESNDFLALSQQSFFKEHIQAFAQPVPNVLHAPFGCGEIITAGRLDTAAYLQACKNYIQQQGTWINETFDEHLLQDGPVYKNEKYKAVVFAQGITATASRLWNFLRFKPAAGEVLDVEIPGLPQTHTWHVGVYATPLGEEVFRVGSTYEHDDLSGLPTEKGKQEILEKLGEAIKTRVAVINHKAGVRPASHDRRPYLGKHPQLNGVYVFNGLGSRGVLLAPMCADLLTRNIVNNEPLPAEWSILRILK